MDKNIHCYATKNFKKSFSIAVPDYITNIETMEYGRTKALKVFIKFLAIIELTPTTAGIPCCFGQSRTANL